MTERFPSLSLNRPGDGSGRSQLLEARRGVRPPHEEGEVLSRSEGSEGKARGVQTTHPEQGEDPCNASTSPSTFTVADHS